MRQLMTTNQRKLIEAVFAVKDDDNDDARHRGIELFGHWHRTVRSLMRQPMPLICIESLGEYDYRPYAFYVHNPLICDCRQVILKVPYLINFCAVCRGIMKPPEWYAHIEERF